MKMPADRELDALADALVQRLLPNLPVNVPGVPMPGVPLEPDPERAYLPKPVPSGGAVDIFLRERIGIAGIELTQSIQHHGAAGTSYGEDNAVPLVALKTLVARVYPYVRPGLLAGDAGSGRVSGELVLSIGNRVVYRTGPTRADGARIGPSNRLGRTLWDEEATTFGSSSGPYGIVQRFELNPSLNFVVPAWYCRRGRAHIAVRIWRVADGVATADQAAKSEYVTFLDVAAPRLCLVRVNWDNGMGTVTRPSDADMLGTVRLAERMLPFPYFETTILSTEIPSTAAFAPPATGGGCNTAWSDLVTELAVTRIFTALFGLGSIVFGMVPTAAIPPGLSNINSGCGKDAGGCFVGYGDTFAHEIGHMYGRPHVGVPGDDKNDPDYPNYGGDRRSIGEVGIDTGTWPPTLYDPATADDIMSYGNTRWISPYTYRRLLDARGTHQAAPADPNKVRPLLVLGIRLHREHAFSKRVELKRAFRVEAAGSVRRNLEGATSPVSIDLRDAEGRVLATHHCFHVPAHGGGSCGCAGGCGHAAVPAGREPYLDLQEAVEWPGDAVASIAFHCGGEALATFEVGRAPRVEISEPRRREGRMIVRVRATHPKETPSVAVLFTADDGATWQPVAFDPPNGEVAVDADRLPGGARCRFRAIATAALRSATAETESFELARQPRRLHLVIPSDPCGTRPGLVALSALVDTRGLGAPAPHEIRWHSSIEGDLGAGLDLIAELSEGRHELTVTAPDGLGGTLAERGIIIVGGRPQRAERPRGN
jgi:hypothetical protein